MINEQNFEIKKNGKPYSRCFCIKPELIENYNKAITDMSQVWDCHHRLETHFSDGTERPKNAQLSKEELVALDMYYNRPSEELIFLTTEEHRFLHKKGKCLSDVTKKKISEAHKGKCLSDITKKKISDVHKGKGHLQTEETRKKISEIMKDKGHPQSEETRKRLSKFYKGKHWRLENGKRIWY